MSASHLKKLGMSAYEYLLGEKAFEQQAAQKTTQKSVVTEASNSADNNNDVSSTALQLARQQTAAQKEDAALEYYAEDIYAEDNGLPPLHDDESASEDSIQSAVSLLDSLSESLNAGEDDSAPIFLSMFKNKFLG